MICVNCGTENRPGRRFCSECATPLALICANCGAANQPGEKFCGECAAPLGADARGVTPRTATESPPSARPAAVAERRLVSVLFADLVGFTPFAEERDAESVRETLTRYFELAREVIDRYGGTVEKFIGDAVMAVWGAPVAHEDDAERAVRAGLELVDAVRSLGPRIQARAGILTGEAAVTLGAIGQGMVAGDLVNTASRLQSVAPPGSVLVGEATHHAASGAIVFEQAGEQVLKGKTAPVPAWRALRVVAEVGGRNRSQSLEAPFVGRDEELRLLKDLFHATGRERRTRLVSINGQAGIGKSRLAWEFLKYIDGLVETVWWHSGRSPAYGEGITFWALGEMVRERAGLAETDDEATTRQKLAETLSTFVLDEDERRWIEPALLALLGSGEIPAGGRNALFAPWRTFFERIASEATVVMVFEDLQWADAGLLDFIDHVLEWSKGVPIYIVTLARPELLERRADWGAGKRNFLSISLEPLGDPQMRALLAGLVPGLPEPAVKAIVARADGIPLYAVETVRMLVTQGKLKETNVGFSPVGDLSALAVPDTLTALIAARLDGLDAIDRSLLQDAAVLGQSFSMAGLAAISGAEDDALESRLRALVRRELLTFVVDPRSPERGQYGFVQGLIREVAYNTLARRDRKVRHLAAARWFESLGEESLAGALATQYVAAHRAADPGPEADALAAQARVALRGAAERAAALGSHAQALALLEEALSVTSVPAEQAELHERAGWSASANADHATAEKHLTLAVELHRDGDDRRGVARATTALGRALLDASRTDHASEILEATVEEMQDLADDPEVIAMRGQLVRAYMLQVKDRKALDLADLVLEAAERLDLIPVIADTLVTRGTSLNQMQRPREGIGVIRIGEALAAANDLQPTRIRAFNNMINTLSEFDPAAALKAGREAIALARHLGLRSSMERSISASANAAIGAGEWDWAEEELQAAFADSDDPVSRALLLYYLIPLRAFRGEPYDRLHQEFVAVRSAQPELIWQTQLHDVETMIALADGRFAEAVDHGLTSNEMERFPWILVPAGHAAAWLVDAEPVRRVLDAQEAAAAPAPMYRADRTTLRAALAGLADDVPGATRLYREALDAWRAIGLVFDEALTAVDMAMVLGPELPEVVAAGDRARTILTRLRARPFLDRLEAALAGGPEPVEASGSTPDGASTETMLGVSDDARGASEAVPSS